jgi:hypothetical protein
MVSQLSVTVSSTTEVRPSRKKGRKRVRTSNISGIPRAIDPADAVEGGAAVVRVDHVVDAAGEGGQHHQATGQRHDAPHQEVAR